MTDPLHERNVLRAYAIRLASLVPLALLLFVSGRLALDYLPKFGLPPCEGPDWVFHSLRGLVGVLIVIGFGLQVGLQHDSRVRRLIVALVVTLAALIVQEVASRHDIIEQRQCKVRSLSQAMQTCEANPAHFRIGESKYGTPVLSLVPPVSTGPAWNCLQAWATYQNDISLEIDEAVYRPQDD